MELAREGLLLRNNDLHPSCLHCNAVSTRGVLQRNTPLSAILSIQALHILTQISAN